MVDDEELELDTQEPKSGGKAKIILLLVAVVLLLSGSVIGVLYFTGNLGIAEDTHSGSEKEVEAASEKKEIVVKPASYVELSPVFVVNLQEQNSATYLQVEMTVLVRDKMVTDHLKRHMPLIRNDILLILGAQKFAEVKNREGKEKLQNEILKKIQGIVMNSIEMQLKAENDGKKIDRADIPNVEQVYFTSFIMQ